MGKKKQADTRNVVRELLRDHPEADTRTLARLLHDQYPHEFPTVEHARSRIRYQRGASGKQRQQIIADKEHFREHGKPKSISFPKGLKQVQKPVKIRTPGKYLVLSDLHVPYHCERALESALKAGIDAGCQHLVLNGDFMDFYRLSRWDQDPRARNPEDELKIGAEVIGELNKHFSSDAVRVFKVGNHEHRYHAYLHQRARHWSESRTSSSIGFCRSKNTNGSSSSPSRNTISESSHCCMATSCPGDSPIRSTSVEVFIFGSLGLQWLATGIEPARTLRQPASTSV